jgi:hypothetical protein
MMYYDGGYAVVWGPIFFVCFIFLTWCFCVGWGCFARDYTFGGRREFAEDAELRANQSYQHQHHQAGLSLQPTQEKVAWVQAEVIGTIPTAHVDEGHNVHNAVEDPDTESQALSKI